MLAELQTVEGLGAIGLTAHKKISKYNILVVYRQKP